ncbi:MULTISPECIES: ATP-binding cassette domain-containing protein [Chryseobacterium]|uniref:Sulfate/thiosulfate import ATP-binding protein CysA n=2 Tax=Chryseobacterium gleum TaxID=250 RepID=A0A448AZL1_CHRGE|nr:MULTISPECIES: ATP-binding cassette domain-containing protein [Chryseobacterium]EFK34161.1 ABC transporter, ATP-binding protein [Chryseobacterium gleum ATCC 35910]AZB32386.1 ATP-binding cassette domain-containing protein [Chryseobacterium bernardetii]MDG4654311.1 ATP-binding cassette domain-containing protein [Chryseobacterium arthrosphaerae]QQY30038.1 ATP-binding cassette domain-containing protein [Chryseobacterium gleum]TLX26329.1 ATP-binding cassette domain-containing protein [Chryseobact
MIEIQIRHQIFTSSGNKFLEVNERISEGSFVHVSGDSGIGKTTFFKILSGLIDPDFGFIKLNDKILLDTANKIFLPPQKRNISLMFQNYALFPNMNVKQNIAFAQTEKDENIVDELLENFALKTFENTSPSKLSGGQQQRVALARTLAQNAEIVLLDEPFSAVDIAMRKVMLNELLEFNKNNNSTLFVISHSEEEFESFSTYNLNII